MYVDFRHACRVTVQPLFVYFLALPSLFTYGSSQYKVNIMLNFPWWKLELDTKVMIIFMAGEKYS